MKTIYPCQLLCTLNGQTGILYSSGQYGISIHAKVEAVWPRGFDGSKPRFFTFPCPHLGTNRNRLLSYFSLS